MFSAKQLRLWMRGPRKQKFFNLVVCYRQTRHRGPLLERVGVFNPHLRQRFFTLNSQRLAFWLNSGVLIHPSVIFVLSKLAVKHYDLLS